MKAASKRFSVIMTWAMADIMAASVPGRMGTHSSARAAAVSVWRGSITTIRAPASLALRRKYSEFVPSRISQGFQLQARMCLEFTQSWRWLPVTFVPYT
jgi:hypothetical protein